MNASFEVSQSSEMSYPLPKIIPFPKYEEFFENLHYRDIKINYKIKTLDDISTGSINVSLKEGYRHMFFFN